MAAFFAPRFLTFGLLLWCCASSASAQLFRDDKLTTDVINLRGEFNALKRDFAAFREASEKNAQAQQEAQAKAEERYKQALAEAQAQLQRGLEALDKRLESLARAQDQISGQVATALSEGKDDLAKLQRDRIDLDSSLRKLQADQAELRKRLTDAQVEMGKSVAELTAVRNIVVALQSNLEGVQKNFREVSSEVDAQKRKIEPERVTVDSLEFDAPPAEIKAFYDALGAMQRMEFEAARGAFRQFLNSYSTPGFKASAHFWLAQAQYALKDYEEAMRNFQRIYALAPGHPRTPEAMLGVAKCQIALQERRPVVRASLENLIKLHPRSKAAAEAKDLLSRLK